MTCIKVVISDNLYCGGKWPSSSLTVVQYYHQPASHLWATEESKACFNTIIKLHPSVWRAKGMFQYYHQTASHLWATPVPKACCCQHHGRWKTRPKLPAFIATSLLCARWKAMLSWYRWSHKQFAHYSDAEWCECQELVKFNVLSATRDSSAWAWLSWMLWLQQWPGAWCRVRQKSVALAAETAEVLKLC